MEEVSDVVQQEQEQAPPPEPTFSAAQLEQARKEGYAAGFRDGGAQVEQRGLSEEAQVERNVASLLSAISSEISEIRNNLKEWMSDKQSILNGIVLGVAKKVAGEALRHAPVNAIEQVVQQCLSTLADNEKFTVYVSPSLLTPMRERIGSIISDGRDAGTITVLSDETLADDNCRVEWKNGMAERDTEKLWAGIEPIIRQMHIPASQFGEGQQDKKTNLYIAKREGE